MNQQGKLVILVIDDEAYRTRLYRQRLEEGGYEVRFCSTIDEAHDVLDDPDVRLCLLIQDLQMGRPDPNGTLAMSEGDWGHYRGLSGLWFLVRHRDWLKSRKVPVMVLTQRKPEEFQDIVQKELEGYGIKVLTRRKLETPAVGLPQIVKEFL